MQTRHLEDDITSPNHQGETWNSCPVCGRSWKDDKPTEGVIHRTRICDNCDGIRRTDAKLFRN